MGRCRDCVAAMTKLEQSIDRLRQLTIKHGNPDHADALAVVVAELERAGKLEPPKSDGPVTPSTHGR
jgi:hypothetical protein